jgi:hemerythrin-like domain-containing protein
MISGRLPQRTADGNRGKRRSRRHLQRWRRRPRREVSADTLRRLEEDLEAHTQLEERSVFPLVESYLSERGLEEIGARLDTE